MKYFSVFLLSLSFVLVQVGHSRVPNTGKARSWSVTQQGPERVMRIEAEDGMTFSIPMLRDRSAAKKIRPSLLAKQFELEAKKLTTSQVLRSSMRRLPVEMAIFFVALGAIAGADTMFRYHLNPDHVGTFLQSQVMPSTHVSMAAFVLTQSVAQHHLMATFGSTRLARHTIPYVGMSAGLVASSLVHEIAAIPELFTCARHLATLGFTGSCDKAWEHFTQMSFDQKLHEHFPSLVGMVISTFLSTGIEIYTVKAAYLTAAGMSHAAAKSKLIKDGIQLLSLGIGLVGGPGGMVVQLGLRVLQTTVFMGLDFMLQPATMYYWQKYADIAGKKNSAEAAVMTRLISHGPLVGNSSNANAGFAPHMPSLEGEMPSIAALASDLSKIYQRERQNELSDYLMAHTNWQAKLDQFSKSYQRAFQGYREILVRVLNYRKDPQSRASRANFDTPNPLYKVQLPNKVTLLVLSQIQQFSELFRNAKQDQNGVRSFVLSKDKIRTDVMAPEFSNLAFDEKGQWKNTDEATGLFRFEKARAEYIKRLANLQIFVEATPVKSSNQSSGREQATNETVTEPSAYKISFAPIFTPGLESIRLELASGDAMRQGKAIQALIDTANGTASGLADHRAIGREDNVWASYILKILGNPKPAMIPGEWMLDELSTSLGSHPAETAIGPAQIASIFGGADPNNQAELIKYTAAGYPAGFTAPRLYDQPRRIIPTETVRPGQVVPLLKYEVEGSDKNPLRMLVDEPPPMLATMSTSDDKWFQTYWVDRFEPSFAKAWQPMQIAFLDNIRELEKRILRSGKDSLAYQMARQMTMLMALMRVTENCDANKCTPIVKDSKKFTEQGFIDIQYPKDSLAYQLQDIVAPFFGFHVGQLEGFSPETLGYNNHEGEKEGREDANSPTNNKASFLGLLVWQGFEKPTFDKKITRTEPFKLYDFEFPSPVISLKEYHEMADKVKTELEEFAKNIEKTSADKDIKEARVAIVKEVRALFEELNSYAAGILAPAIQTKVGEGQNYKALEAQCQNQRAVGGIGRIFQNKCE